MMVAVARTAFLLLTAICMNVSNTHTYIYIYQALAREALEHLAPVGMNEIPASTLAAIKLPDSVFEARHYWLDRGSMYRAWFAVLEVSDLFVSCPASCTSCNKKEAEN